MDTTFLTQLLKRMKLNGYFVFGAAFAFFVGLLGAVIWLLPTEPAQLPDLAQTPNPVMISQLPVNIEFVEQDGQLIPQGLPVTYEVQPGDSSWTIAVAFYGSGFNYVDIETANNLLHNAELEIGQQLLIPQMPVRGQGRVGEIEAVPSPTTALSAVLGASEDKEKYVIQSGDSLWKIAETQLGDPYRWVEIYTLNANVLGGNPDLIYPGAKLDIPQEK